MTIKHLFPPAFPKLDLNFAAERSLDPRITFSRSSIGTYVDATGILRTAAEDEPRFDHSGTGKSLGLLIEESRTNAITYSFDLGNTGTGGWYTDANKGGLNGSGNKNYFVTQSNTTDTFAPDGTYTATKLSAPSTILDPTPDPIVNGTAIHLVSKVQPSAGASSFYIKDPSNFANGLDKIGIMSGDRFNSSKGIATFDLVNNQVSTRNAASDAKIEAVGNGWYRISCATGEDGVFTFSAWNALTSDLYIWGAQHEEGGSFATSYIATNGTAEDRAADICSIEGDNFSSWYNQSEGTIFAEFLSGIYRLGFRRILAFADDDEDRMSHGNGIVFGSEDNSRLERLSWRVRGSVVTKFPVTSTPPNKTILTYASSDLASANDGGTVTTFTNSPPTGLDRLNIFPPNAPIARLAYYPRRLSDEQLKALTA